MIAPVFPPAEAWWPIRCYCICLFYCVERVRACVVYFYFAYFAPTSIRAGERRKDCASVSTCGGIVAETRLCCCSAAVSHCWHACITWCAWQVGKILDKHEHTHYYKKNMLISYSSNSQYSLICAHALILPKKMNKHVWMEEKKKYNILPRTRTSSTCSIKPSSNSLSASSSTRCSTLWQQVESKNMRTENMQKNKRKKKYNKTPLK